MRIIHHSGGTSRQTTSSKSDWRAQITVRVAAVTQDVHFHAGASVSTSTLYPGMALSVFSLFEATSAPVVGATVAPTKITPTTVSE